MTSGAQAARLQSEITDAQNKLNSDRTAVNTAKANLTAAQNVVSAANSYKAPAPQQATTKPADAQALCRWPLDPGSGAGTSESKDDFMACAGPQD